VLNGLDVRYTTENGNSYLHEAALYNNSAAADILLKGIGELNIVPPASNELTFLSISGYGNK